MKNLLDRELLSILAKTAKTRDMNGHRETETCPYDRMSNSELNERKMT